MISRVRPGTPLLIALFVLLSDPGGLQAQSEEAGPVSPDSADVIREGLERPSTRRPVTAGDVLAFPLKVATFPLTLAFDGVAELFGFVGQPERWRRLVRTYMRFGELGIRPGLTTELGPRSGLGMGLRYIGLSPFTFEAGGSTRRYQLYRLAVDGQWERWEVELGGGWRRHAQERFWGLGPESGGADAPVGFRWDRTWTRGRAAVHPLEPLTFEADVTYEENRVGEGAGDDLPGLDGLVDPAELTGARGVGRYVRTGLQGSVDFTTWRHLQIRGLRAGGRVSRHWGVEGTEGTFTRLSGWAQGFLPVTPRQHIATRVRVEASRDGGDGIPFTHLPGLGGDEYLRSFDWGRFRDRDLFLATGEWRYEVWRDLREQGRIEGVAFWETGGVAPRLGDLDDLRSSYGIGMVVVWDQRLMGHMWVALGDEGPRVSGSFSAPFSLGPGGSR